MWISNLGATGGSAQRGIEPQVDREISPFSRTPADQLTIIYQKLWVSCPVTRDGFFLDMS